MSDSEQSESVQTPQAPPAPPPAEPPQISSISEDAAVQPEQSQVVESAAEQPHPTEPQASSDPTVEAHPLPTPESPTATNHSPSSELPHESPPAPEQAQPAESVPEPTPAPQPAESQERIIERVRQPNEEDVRAFNSNQLKALAPKAREVRRSKKQNRLDAIVEHLKVHGYITNDDVEKLLHVSDATATRYLRELVKSGIAIKLGRGGRGARYRLVQGNQ